jgi:hypothetical protein
MQLHSSTWLSDSTLCYKKVGDLNIQAFNGVSSCWDRESHFTDVKCLKTFPTALCSDIRTMMRTHSGYGHVIL